MKGRKTNIKVLPIILLLIIVFFGVLFFFWYQEIHDIHNPPGANPIPIGLGWVFLWSILWTFNFAVPIFIYGELMNKCFLYSKKNVIIMCLVVFLVMTLLICSI